MLRRLLNFTTHRIHELPVVVLMPHSRCNCRCVMCDIWKANQNKQELSIEELSRHVDAFVKLRVGEVVLSGGEALMHPNLWSFCKSLHEKQIKVTLLSTGLLLKQHASSVVDYIDEVIVSLDGSQPTHDKIRNIPRAFEQLREGVLSLRKLAPGFPISGRCVLQRHNFSDLQGIIHAAKDLKLDRISFLSADVSSTAFNHSPVAREKKALNPDERLHDVALTLNEVNEFKSLLEKTIVENRADFESGFIAENPGKLSKIAQYYSALNGDGDFPKTICNAPWVSAVIESDGRVMPCFFLPEYGNIYDQQFVDVINSERAVNFRKHLDVNTNPVCQRCVCTLKLGMI